MCFLRGRGERLIKVIEKKTTEKLHAAGKLYTSFKNSNIEHVKKLTEKWFEMTNACLKGKGNIISWKMS